MSDTTETVIPFETVRVPNGDKPKGFEEVISDGSDGKRTVTKSENGQILSDRTKHPRNEIIYFGTKESGEDSDSLSTGDADDATASNSTETVLTPDPPQEELKKQPPQNNEVDKDSFVPPITGYSHQSQGRLSEHGGNLMERFSMSETLKKAALEAGRLLVFAIPGILITVLTNNPELGGSLGATILLILKSIDRGIHEDKSTESTGILPF